MNWFKLWVVPFGAWLGLFMKKLALAVSVLAANAMGASAADMVVKAPQYKAPEATVSTWTGFYVGASLGGEQANANWTTTSIAVDAPGFVIPPPTVDGSSPRRFNPLGGRYGGFAGYDYQSAAQWVAGIVVDVAYFDSTVTTVGAPGCTVTCILGVPGPGVDVSSVRAKWDADVRGRLGYLVTPNVLLYGTGGIAFQKFSNSITCETSLTDPLCGPTAIPAAATATNSSIRTGWTAGVGVDAKIFANWMLRAEYRYSDFGTWSNSLLLVSPGVSVATVATNLKINTHIGMIGIAYRFGGPVVAKY
ncbi:outer membrane beta-barrel protein [Bradyrhizobium sp. SSUT18]|uniref:outer membrane protein n=1 Tax=Bradyrhizobium sp. SSUT18 TaxID=3040602 RepID=UPI00244C219F|nr:outer membrane beta-barrel protein [Bradyrhizobium sp. SSUT18]MDH2405069.1 outer membrane beta-barrel protein [Bradyrhizobium sp. SSUT18]